MLVMRNIIHSLLIFVSILALLTHCARDENVVAEVGSLTISKEELIKELKRIYPNKVLKEINLEDKKTLINRMAEHKQKVNAAYDLNLDEEDKIVTMANDRRDRMIGNKYYEKVIVDQFVSEEEIKKDLERQGTELKATHILISYKKANQKVYRTKEEAKALAKKIANQAQNGADFTKLAVENSNDASVKENKGDLSYFKWGQMVPAFQDAAWNLKIGEISDPVETRYGFHIIRLDDRREDPNYVISTDDEDISAAKQRLYKAHADSARALWQKHYQNLKEKYSYQLHSEALNNIANMLTERLKTDKLTYESFSQEELESKLVTWEGGSFTFQMAIANQKSNLERILPRYKQVKFLQREVEGQTILRMVVIDAKQYKIAEDKTIEQEVNKLLEQQLAQLVEKREIEEKAIVTEEATIEYYQNNPDKFIKKEEIEIWEIHVKDENLAKKILEKAKSGQDFTELAKKYSEDQTSASNGGYMGFRFIKGRGAVSKEAFKLGPGGKIGGPIKYRKGWTIIKTGQKHDESIKPFEEVKKLAESYVHSERIRENRVQWEKQLKEKYPIKIFDEKLKEI
jgi:parvulin-like peptidyl-prolyl isomerase